MDNPKPVHKLTRWKVLSDEAANALVCQGSLQRQVPDIPTDKFTDAELERLRNGETLFCVWKGELIMVAYRHGRFLGYEVERRKAEPPKTVAQKAREFFKYLFTI